MEYVNILVVEKIHQLLIHQQKVILLQKIIHQLAVSDGEVIITAKFNNSKQDTLKLVIKRNPILVEKILINNSISKMNVGEELALHISVVPENSDNKGFVVSSSNEDVIKVVDNKIKAVSSGDAVITVCSNDKNAKH